MIYLASPYAHPDAPLLRGAISRRLPGNRHAGTIWVRRLLTHRARPPARGARPAGRIALFGAIRPRVSLAAGRPLRVRVDARGLARIGRRGCGNRDGQGIGKTDSVPRTRAQFRISCFLCRLPSSDGGREAPAWSRVSALRTAGDDGRADRRIAGTHL